MLDSPSKFEVWYANSGASIASTVNLVKACIVTREQRSQDMITPMMIWRRVVKIKMSSSIGMWVGWDIPTLISLLDIWTFCMLRIVVFILVG
jgi:hypothetical protein